MMQALRKRAACVVRQSRPTVLRNVRRYASDSHGHDHHAAPKVAEGLGTAFYVFAGVVPASMFFYGISRPGADGEPSSLTRWLSQFEFFAVDKARNTIRTNMIEQAAHDKHLFMNSEGPRHVDLKMPELIGHCSPYNVPAGHSIDLSKVAEVYRERFHAEEERKAKALAAKASK